MAARRDSSMAEAAVGGKQLEADPLRSSYSRRPGAKPDSCAATHELLLLRAREDARDHQAPRRPGGAGGRQPVEQGEDRLEGHVGKDGRLDEPVRGSICSTSASWSSTIVAHPVHRHVLPGRHQRDRVVVEGDDRPPPQLRRRDGEDARAGAGSRRRRPARFRRAARTSRSSSPEPAQRQRPPSWSSRSVPRVVGCRPVPKPSPGLMTTSTRPAGGLSRGASQGGRMRTRPIDDRPEVSAPALHPVARHARRSRPAALRARRTRRAGAASRSPRGWRRPSRRRDRRPGRDLLPPRRRRLGLAPPRRARARP